ncbi:ABC transporter substrate-binding protein [Nocardioides psychrotolerans]|uniref:Polar amino acid transport system substrate-binding protein n=1 Tax=Nocardioides psychrotolerans TaxID=1005945 RepID=A0A1I3CPG0_9ACTN|nr:glutamate ABC transporter substrate-binding protein [Nocardioides psychrotolerans]GEP36847.1 ABC transporter substrate-binding protein [Nocardioides psychrotolerans]SFH76402.1 polar amino acid transport system substrate-binding protein [Nocardioides psychrotolerans]
MSRRAGPVVVVAALAVLLAGCGGYDETVVADPEAAPASSVPPATTPPVCDNATQSYAPSGPLPAPDDLPPGSTMEKIRDRGRLIAGVSADTYLLASNSPFTGQIEGFDIDMVEQVADAIFGDPKAYELKVITAGDRLPALVESRVDIVVRNMTINCARWEEIAFSAEYYRSGQKILVREDLADDGVDSVTELGGVRVCAPTGTSSLDNVRREAPDAVVVEAPTHTGCLALFQEGEVDAITGDDTVLAGLAAQDPYAVVPEQETFTDEPYGIGVNAADVDLVRFVNSILERMRSDGSWRASYLQWLQPTLGQGAGQPQPIYGRTP